MVVVFTIIAINYLILSLFCNLMGPLSHCICGIRFFGYAICQVLWLRYLPCFCHNDKSSYGFSKIIHHILIEAHQIKLFSNKCSLNLVFQIVWFYFNFLFNDGFITMLYSRATQLADRGPNPDLLSFKTGPRAPG